jgi:hypothetical protein
MIYEPLFKKNIPLFMTVQGSRIIQFIGLFWQEFEF